MKNKEGEIANSRRKFLQRTLAILPVTAISGTAIAKAVSSEEIKKEENFVYQYVPIFFNNEEWRFIIAATDRLIPEDDNGPGAVSEGVPLYIDKQMELPYGHGSLWYMQPPFEQTIPELGYQTNLVPRDIYRRGIKAVNDYCLNQYKMKFAELTLSDQEAILHDLESGHINLTDISSKLFFSQLLENTKEGYLADPIHGGNRTQASWKMIGFPGARADFVQVLDNPNTHYPLGPVSISGKNGA